MRIHLILRSDVGEPLYLTPFIQAGLIDQGQSAARVSFPLDGLTESEQADLESFSGFITVNEDEGSNMFFWFFPAAVSDASSLNWAF